VSDTETPEDAAANKLRSDFPYALWTGILLFENEGVPRATSHDIIAHFASASEDAWWTALAATARRRERQAIGRAVFDRSRSTPDVSSEHP